MDYTGLRLFKQLLLQMDVNEMARHSIWDHHVQGMNYLCLHRDERLTAKIYMVERPWEANRNAGFLVHPHSHRYGFSSLMLNGNLRHIRFKETSVLGEVDIWDKQRYNPDTKTLTPVGHVGLAPYSEFHERGSSYFVRDDEIHTLQMTGDAKQGPVMIGLFQLRDTKVESDIYLSGETMEMAPSRQPTVAELSSARDLGLHLLDWIR